MGRKSQYESHVKPNFDKISELYKTMNEEEIAQYLGISARSWYIYKKEHKEFRELLIEAAKTEVQLMKDTLKRKALGYYYDETKTVVKKEPTGTTKITETYHKYAQPDTGAAHLWLKNHDPSWHNDDETVIKLKKEMNEISKKKAEKDDW